MKLKSKMKFKNPVRVECIKPDGTLRWSENVLNGITDSGMNTLIDTMFHGSTAIDPWYLGLIDNAGFSAVANGDTMASHSGWTEFTSYSESTRQEFVEAAAASRATDNSASPAAFTISVSGSVKGVFVVGDSAKSGTTGPLWSTALFTSSRTVEVSDVLRITYGVSG
jgi:hypothetical protein